MDFDRLLKQHTQGGSGSSDSRDHRDRYNNQQRGRQYDDYHYRGQYNNNNDGGYSQSTVDALNSALPAPRYEGGGQQRSYHDGGYGNYNNNYNNDYHNNRGGYDYNSNNNNYYQNNQYQQPRGRRGGRHNNRGRGRNNNYHNRRGNYGSGDPDEGKVIEVETGVFRYNKVWGYYGKWDAENWKSETPGNVLIQFEAKGEDNICFAISPEARTMIPMYEVVIGGWKNSKSVIRRETQGDERALAFQNRLCSQDEFIKYWALLRDGTLSVGIGDTPGKRVFLSWKDPEPVQAQFVSFTSWDHVCTFRNITIGSGGEDMEMEDVETSKFVPDYLHKLEQERQAQKDRAEKFGTEYKEQSMQALAKNVLSEAEQERLKHALRDSRDEGFVTGFDPTTEEERKKAEERAKRFQLPNTEGDEENKEDGDEDMLSRAKREARAKRFDIPVLEDQQMGQGLVRDLSGLRVPRKDPEAEDLPRPDTIHIYGYFDQVYTKDIYEWFEDYGASRIEWLHDCGANVVFADDITAKRALAHLGRPLPPIPEHADQIEVLKQKGYLVAPFPLLEGHANQYRFFLFRPAFVTDVKAAKDSGYCTTQGYNKRRGRGGRRGRIRARNAPMNVDGNTYNNNNNANDNDTSANITGNKRRSMRDDEDDDNEQQTAENDQDEMDEDNPKRKRVARDDDDDEANE